MEFLLRRLCICCSLVLDLDIDAKSLQFSLINQVKLNNQNGDSDMQIRVQRRVNVIPEYQNKFLDLALRGVERIQETMGIQPDLFLNLYTENKAVEVRIFTDFESMAQYEELFLHKVLRDDSFLDAAESAVEMVYDNPQDEMYVRMDIEDYFMNRKGGAIKRSNIDLSHEARLNKQPATFRTEREYYASKGRLRDVMQMNFEFADDLKASTGIGADYFCTRFSAARIGSSKLYFDHDDCPQCGEIFLEQDQLISSHNDGLLLRRPITTVYKRITAETLGFNVKKFARASASA